MPIERLLKERIIMMKKQFVWISVLLFLLTGGALFAQDALALDEAIRSGVEDLEARLTRGSKVAVLNFKSPSRRFSDYVLDEIMTEMVNNRRVTVVDRASLNLIRDEMDFQLSGDVSDDSAQRIGQMLGAQAIISGQIDDMGTFYRMRFRAISVETAAILAQPTYNVRKDNQIATLMGGSSSSSVAASAAPASGLLQPDGLHFSSGHKVSAGFLNLLFGIGSFTMGDTVGGLIIGAMQITGNIMLVMGAIGDEYYDYDDYVYYEPNTGLLLAGLGIGLAANIYGFVRPWRYDVNLSRSRGTYIGFEGNPMWNISITPVSTTKGMNWGVLYCVSY
jgi:TolB-like protein